jgi:hypothetical protein
MFINIFKIFLKFFSINFTCFEKIKDHTSQQNRALEILKKYKQNPFYFSYLISLFMFIIAYTIVDALNIKHWLISWIMRSNGNN